MKNKSEKIVKALVKILLILLIIFMISIKPTQADVGFHSSSGSSSHSSSSHSSSSSSSSSHSSSSRSSSSSSSSEGSSIIGFIILIVIIVVIIASKKRSGNESSYISADATQSVEEKIREIDPAFSAEAFMSFGKEVYIKIQNAWMQKKWEDIRPYESNELFEQHRIQLQSLIDAKQTNKMERICIKYTCLNSFNQDGDKELITMTLKAAMLDYIIDDQTGKVVQGNQNEVINMSYRLTFMRKVGVKTKEGTDNINTTNCPNCGAPTKITSSGKCEYCGSVITTGKHGWVLIKLEGSRD